MALEIKMDDKFGNGGVKYWKVVEINRNLLIYESRVVLAGYVNEEARRGGKQMIESITFDYNKENNPFTLERLNKEGVSAVDVAYEAIKQDERFATAKDI